MQKPKVDGQIIQEANNVGTKTEGLIIKGTNHAGTNHTGGNYTGTDYTGTNNTWTDYAAGTKSN